MNFEPTADQRLMRESFARTLDDLSNPERIRAAQKSGFDQTLCYGLAEMGVFALRVPTACGGMGLGTLDAAILMEEAGRTLATGPLIETILSAALLARFGASELTPVIEGKTIATLAPHDIADSSSQWLSGGAHARLVIARERDKVVLLQLNPQDRKIEPSLASNGIGEVNVSGSAKRVLGSGGDAVGAFMATMEEWKLLTAAMLGGLAKRALVLAANYASEREAFGVKIGTFQGISHPLANLVTDVDAGRLLVWKAVHAIAHRDAEAGACTSLAMWWMTSTAGKVGIQSTRTFGGYGLSTEYDIHLYNVRAKALGLIHGDPDIYLEEAGRRLYGGETASLPDVGDAAIEFDLGEDARQLAEEVRQFFAATLTPELRKRAHHSWDGHVAEVHKKLAQANLLFPAWPKDKGGRGASPYARYAAHNVWLENNWSTHAVQVTLQIAAMIEKFGSEKARRDIMEPILAGDIICSLGYSEPGSGSDVFAVKTRATRDGDGWRINGTKMFTSGANIAQFVLMLVRTNPNLPKHKGLTMFLTPLDAPGVTVQKVETFQDERTNITFYDNVYIPDDYRLGDVDGGVRTMSAALEMEHSGGGFAPALRRVAEATATLCKDIVRGGRPLIEQPTAQKRIAATMAYHYLSQMLSLRALWAAENKIHVPAAGSMTKLFSSEALLWQTSDMMNLTAPASLSMREGAAETINLNYRYAHGATTWAGTSEIHRSIIAEQALGLPRSRG